MTNHFATTPVRYSPDVEHIDPGEPQIARDLAETMLSIAQKTYADSGHATRAVHVKSHGLLKARLEVLPDLSPQLAQGLFGEARTYEAVIRLSTAPGDLLHDSVSTPRGIALKLLDIDGTRLPGSERSTSQDFVMLNGKTFNSASGKAFLRNLKVLALTTDRLEGMKEFLSKVFKGLESVIEAVGVESATLKSLGGNPQTHILGESFFSQLPLRHGDYIAKLAIVPASHNLQALAERRLDTSKDPDVIRHEVESFFARETAVWHLQVQLCTDLATMPVEGVDAWNEEISPFLTIAHLVTEPQPAWNEERSEIVDDGMHFSPWNGLKAHQPLGSIMRLRKLAYEKSAAFRSQRNLTPVSEPVSCPFAHGARQ
ncbi:catalase family protein [Shinella sp. CPCC 101442]|uniref:catalase family protein n=1 Tax=Shinella sp. CPCC 101442 TaxID=2932265 RepID=UPI0021531C48|nr:catalase family protein [Shinella sp. CPCC 101442]MCR6502013.1 catalase family protein [Shinella sp. CPCC 101442]